MRFILWLVLGLTALYGGYWTVATRTIRAEAEARLAAMRAEGTADAAALDVGGFPARFDVTLTAPRAASRDGSLRWSAPDLRLTALAYRPQHVIALFPATQELAIGGETISVASGDLAASAVFALSADAALDRAQLAGTGVALTSDAGWGLLADELRAAVRRGAGEREQELGIELAGLTLSGRPAGLVTAGDVLPARGERFYLDAVLGFDRPLDRFAATGGLRILSADIRALSLDWGPAGLSGRGSLVLSASGVPEGRIELSLRNWKAALQLATALGLVRPESAPTVRRALEGLAGLGGDPEVLTLPLVLAGGRMSLGPVPLGAAPRF